MLRSAPQTPTQTLDGMLLVKVCDERGCVVAPVALTARAFANDAWYVAYWDPEQQETYQMVCGEDACSADALRRMIAAIMSVALAPAQP